MRLAVEDELRAVARTWGADLGERVGFEADAAMEPWGYLQRDGLPPSAVAAAVGALATRKPLEIGTASRVALDAAAAALAAIGLWLTGASGQRLTSRQLADALTTRPGAPMLALLPRWRQHADLTISRAANVTLLEASDAAHVADPSVGLLKRDVEVMDLRRNHPISRVLDGMTIPVQALFHAPASEVERWAARLRKPMGGIFWRQVGGDYVGPTLPAHYGERGVVVPWLPKWGP